MNKKAKYAQLLTIVIAFIFIGSILIMPAQQVSANSLHFMIAPTPPELPAIKTKSSSVAQSIFAITPTLVLKEMGEDFLVEVTLTTDVSTNSSHFKLSWLRSNANASLTCTEIEKGSFFTEGAWSITPSDCTYAGYMQGSQQREAGTGILAKIHLKAKTGGSYNGQYILDLFDCQVDNTPVTNVTDGTALIGCAGTLEISPASISANEGNAFSAAVKLTTTKPINSAGFQLSWIGTDGSSHLTCSKLEKGDFFPSGIAVGGGISTNNTTSPFAVGMLGGQVEAKTGTLAVSNFSGPRGTYNLHLYDSKAAIDNEEFPLLLKDGTVTITEPRPPIAPSNLRLVSVGFAEATLAWQDNSSDETGFQVTRADNSSFTLGVVPVFASSGNNVTTFTDYTLSKEKKYYYRVNAWNQLGPSAFSNVLEVSTWPSLPPAPTELGKNTVSDTYVELTWKDNAPNELGYRIERAIDDSFTRSLVKVFVGPDLTTYMDYTVQRKQGYYYRVIAYNTYGDSLPSNTYVFFTPEGIPAAPTELKIQKADEKKVTMVWKDNATDETGFTIHRCLNNSFESSVSRFKVTGADQTSYTDDTVAEGRTFYYRITAYNNNGESSVSNTATVVMPKKPTELMAELVNLTQVSLTWKDNDTAEEGYRIERSLSLGFIGSLNSYYVGPNINKFTDSETKPGTAYFYRVYTINRDVGDYTEIFTNESPPSNIVTCTTGIPPDPKTLKMSSVSLADSVDDNGITKKSISVTNLAGIKALEIGTDVQCLTGDDQPLLKINVSEVKSDTLSLLKHRIIALPSTLFKPGSSSSLPAISVTQEHDAQLVGPVVDLQPSGAEFSSPISISLEYDGKNFPKDAAQNELVLAYYDAHADKWVELPTKVSPMGSTIRANISHFSTIGVIRKMDRVVEWWHVIAIIAVEMVIAMVLLIVLIMKRRNNYEWDGTYD